MAVKVSHLKSKSARGREGKGWGSHVQSALNQQPDERNNVDALVVF